MDEATLVVRDADASPQQRDQPNVPGEPHAAHDDDAGDADKSASVKEEDEQLPPGDGAVLRPAKRRKLDDTTPRRSISRAVSPPWKPFAADGPTTIFDNGIRKSSRVNREAPEPAPEPAKRSSRKPKATQTNGTSGAGSKHGLRAASGSAAQTRGKTAADASKKKPAAVQTSPARKSERNKKPSALAAAAATTASSSPSTRQNGSPESVRKRPGRPRRATQASLDNEADTSPAYANGYHASTDDAGSASQGPRLRLRLRKVDPPNCHPQHAPPPTQYSSLTEWLEHDDPLEGEEGQRITDEKAEEEAERRLQIVEAAEHGVLSTARCSVFAPQPAEEPPPLYGHWHHVIAHAQHFNKLLKEEKVFHRRIARTLAREAVEYWKEKYKHKTQEEIDQEESERAVLRYKQLVKDVKDSWALVKNEIDKERVAKWEEEQLQLGHKAMDDMFNQAQEILGRSQFDSASSFVSDDRDTEGDGEDFESKRSAASEAEVDENMSSSSDSEEGQDNDDEDTNLTADQLRAKYGQLPDLPDDSSSDEESEDENLEVDDDVEGTPDPTLDPNIAIEDAGELSNYSSRHTSPDQDENMDIDAKESEEIDPAGIELEQVDQALLDSEDEDAKASESGSEAWSSDEDSAESEAGQSDAGSDASNGVGVMGFLAPSEIKKMKEAAKSSVDDSKPDTPATSMDSIHQDQDAEQQDEKPYMNGHHESSNGHESPHVNGENITAAPSSMHEDFESESVIDVAQPRSQSPKWSRQSSESLRTEIPSLLRGNLREYQHDGLDWLANLYDSETNGILADEMGLGKTIQTISLLAYIAVNRHKWGPHLVVVPTSVMLNWEMEFKKWCPGFKILTYYGDINERKKKRLGWRTTGRDMYNVVITSYQLILQDAAAFKMRAWQYLILDEAHNIKNFKSQRWQTMLNLRTERRLLLTGTPLQNNIDELWSLLYFLMPAGFAGEGRIAGLEEFTMALKNPTSQILEQGRQQLDAEAQKIVKKLHEVLRPYLLRRLKSEVEKQMPAKYEHVVYCKLSKRQRQLYDGFMGRASTKEILTSGNYMSIINCLMSLRKVCNHPDLFETRAIVTSMAMPKSVTAEYEIKDLLVRKRLNEGMEENKVSLDALNLVFARREQTSMLHARRSQQIRATRPLQDLIERQTRRINRAGKPKEETTTVESTLAAMTYRQNVAIRNQLQSSLRLTRARTQFLPIYGKGLVNRLTMDYQTYTFGAQEQVEALRPEQQSHPVFTPMMPYQPMGAFGQPPVHHGFPQHPGNQPVKMVKYWKPGRKGLLGFRSPMFFAQASDWYQHQCSYFADMIPTLEQRGEALEPLITRFTCVTPAVAAEELAPLALSKHGVNMVRSTEMARQRDPFHESRIRQSIAFPDKRLLQYDCGKLQRLAVLLRELQAGGHRALIFTQMTKVLDILEQFLNIHGHRYLRLDGATKVEQRQILTDRFNSDPKILCFILSSRSGGLGINLTGADTVIFYDLDWNPAMDKQCQDRSHRIGQTRDVHIYKFVSEYTIEANILRKSNQKRLLDDVIIQKGDFTTDTFLNKVSWRDALANQEADDAPVPEMGDEAGAAMDRVLGERAGLLGDSRLMGTVEDREDQTAASVAQKEIVDEIHDDHVDFNESNAATPKDPTAAAAAGEGAGDADDGVDGAGEKRHVDEYMLEWCREEFGGEPYKPPTDRSKQKKSKKGGDVHRTRKKKAKY